jgi:hypothetical protein
VPARVVGLETAESAKTGLQTELGKIIVNQP